MIEYVHGDLVIELELDIILVLYFCVLYDLGVPWNLF